MDMDESLPAALDTVIDPISGKGLIASGRAAKPRFEDGTVSVVIDVSGLSGDARSKLETAVKQTLVVVPGVETVRVAMTAEKRGRKLLFFYNVREHEADTDVIRRTLSVVGCPIWPAEASWQVLAEPDPVYEERCRKEETPQNVEL